MLLLGTLITKTMDLTDRDFDKTALLLASYNALF